MTELSTEPIAETPPAPTTPPQADPAPAPAEVTVEHTAGGWPVVPIAMTGANSTVTALAAAALAGGPIAAAVAATGACVLGVAAATRNHRAHRKHATGRTNRAATHHGGRTGRGTGGVHGASSRGTSGRSAKHAGRSTSRTGSTGSVPHQRKTTGNRPGKAAGHTSGKPTRQHGPGRAGQVKALRASARQAAPSRAARRSETTGSRRAVADVRRGAKTAARSASMARKGPIGRSVGKAAGRVGAAKGAVIDRNRSARDQRAAGKVTAQRSDVRKAPARKKARKALWRSAARFQGRRLRAALLGGALGLVGMLTTPLGRKLGWAWLMYPGRRLYARMTHTAKEQRHLRDDAIRVVLQDDETAADTEAADNSADQVGAAAERPTGPTPAVPATSSSEGENVSGFRFEEYAAEMESAAGQYDPENAMEILSMVEGLPAALTSVANVMKVLAERADSEFPLEKGVADGFNDIFGAVMSAVAVAEDMGPLFRQSHEQDIARHEDPRNGPEAEKGWNV
ncbi:hypothetical protein OHA33_18815 [Streptomyces sp. NBC_00562]|uniref:hypothetical protein n=1 Tax=Streptomyces sp. NBC_00562 TaxID=2975777 RepID=UPI002E8081A9|nr:hypothetical protein [Streptomyces sp. NBC_00562]WUC20755.1 hypothetical protein OHA33_18815 [Streptomyces sp. NBC_00562]